MPCQCSPRFSEQRCWLHFFLANNILFSAHLLVAGCLHRKLYHSISFSFHHSLSLSLSFLFVYFALFQKYISICSLRTIFGILFCPITEQRTSSANLDQISVLLSLNVNVNKNSFIIIIVFIVWLNDSIPPTYFPLSDKHIHIQQQHGVFTLKPTLTL